MSKRLRAAREEAGLSRKALADLIGASERLVNYYEDPSYGGHRKPIYVRLWAEHCGYQFEDIWGAPTPSDQGIARTRCRVQSPVAA